MDVAVNDVALSKFPLQDFHEIPYELLHFDSLQLLAACTNSALPHVPCIDSIAFDKTFKVIAKVLHTRVILQRFDGCHTF